MMDNKKFVYAIFVAGLALAVCIGLIVSTYARRVDVALAQSKDPGPLHGESPIFTVRSVVICKSDLGPFCDEWAWCGNSPPKISTPEKLWNAYVVPGKDGPVLVCEWHDKRDER